MERLTNCRVAFLTQVLDHIDMAFSRISILISNLILVSIFILFGHKSNSAIVLNSVSVGGASNAISQSTNQWQAYGAFIGPDKSFTGTTTYNNCDVAQPTRFVGCNNQRVSGTTILSVSFLDDIQFAGTKNVLVYNKTNFVIGSTPQNLSTELAGNFTQGSNFVGRVTWQALCVSAGGTIQDYAIASGLFGGGTTSACMNGATPLNKSVQFAFGVIADTGGVASSEILIDVRFYTPSPFIGGFEPSNITTANSIEGADGFVNKPGKNGVALIGLSGASGTSNTSPNPVGSPTETYFGFVDYQIKPGDEKIRMEARSDIPNTLDTYGPSITAGDLVVPIKGYVLYLSNSGFPDTQPWLAPSLSTALLNTSGNISSGFNKSTLSTPITKNEREVYSRLATIDDSGSITHLFSDGMLAANCPLPAPAFGSPTFYRYFVGAIPQPDDPSTPEIGRCPYATIPSLVTGLLEEDINCFVATALKNSPYDYQVLALREFRNRFLKSFSLGRSFIDFYYSKGPFAAKWLNENPQFKPVFRVLLWPAYLVAFLFNSAGGFFGLVLLMTLLLTPMIFWNLRRKTFFQS